MREKDYLKKIMEAIVGENSILQKLRYSCWSQRLLSKFIFIFKIRKKGEIFSGWCLLFVMRVALDFDSGTLKRYSSLLKPEIYKNRLTQDSDASFTFCRFTKCLFATAH